ncbi:Fractalkine [Heterocephalus glaber]|uniref:Fractalkine n=1 Tax=Heterocephalus glaber TaxID=10181 RepID=G5AUE3_HETGA|nr:Fractalkine [Heterocephalus glaber]
MAPTPLSGLLRLAVLCHLTVLLAGQHHGVTKCKIICDKMASEIPKGLLLHYQRNQVSCGKPAIILETKRHRFFCADPREKWVQEAMVHIDNQTPAPTTPNGGKFEKHVGKPETTPAAQGMSQPSLTEPEATGESSNLEPTASSQGTQRPMETSPELPVRVTGSLRTRVSPTSKAPDGDTEIFSTASVSTAIAQQRSAAYQSGSSPGAQEKAPSTPPPTIEPPSTQTPPTSHPTTEGQPVWKQEQMPSPQSSVGPKERGPPAHTDAFEDWGPSSMAHASVVPISSEGTPSQEPVALGSLIPKTENPIHATVDPQRQGLITPVPDTQAATRRQAVGLLAFLGLLFCLGVAMFAYQSLQGCPRKMAGEMVEGLRYVPRSCGSNSYVLVPV